MINTMVSEDISELPLIRPQSLSEYIGQNKIKSNLEVSIKAAQKRNEPLDHILFYGPPGLGKTTISMLIAKEMGTNIQITSGPAIEKQGDLVAILNNLNNGDILFIDEIHRIPKVIEEVLYSAMEDFKVCITIGKDCQTRSITLDLPRFTLIGATTRAGMLSAPLRDRFGALYKMEYYENKDLCRIIERTSKILKIKIDPSASLSIAKASRGTPRIANTQLRRVRDFAEVIYHGLITDCEINEIFKALDIHENGLRESDLEYLKILYNQNNCNPVGISTIAAALGEDIETIEDMYEPYLIKEGYILKTPKGRVITSYGIQTIKKIA